MTYLLFGWVVVFLSSAWKNVGMTICWLCVYVIINKRSFESFMCLDPDTVSQNQIRSSLVLHNMIQAVCGRMQLSLKVGDWCQAGCVLSETGLSDSYTLACLWTRYVWPKCDFVSVIQIGLGSVLHSMVLAFFGKMEPNRRREVRFGIYNLARFWLHAGHDSHNWP